MWRADGAYSLPRVVTLVAGRRSVAPCCRRPRRALGEDVREAMEARTASYRADFLVEVRTARQTARLRNRICGGSVRPNRRRQRAPPDRRQRKDGSPGLTLERARTNIGRMPELTDADHRVVRRNDVVFEEGADEANATVSRKHAHVRLDGTDYRLCDDGSEFGTRVFRDGRSIEVPSGDRRGEKLRSGDEDYLGRACLSFERA